MRRLCLFLLFSIAFSFLAAAEDKQPKPRLSKDPLTKEQIAVYRAVLTNYMESGNGTLNLANKTEPLEMSGPFSNKDCAKSLELEPEPKSGPVVHAFDPAVDLGVKIVLVDPEAQVKTVKKNDPENVIHATAKNGKSPKENEIGDAVKKAFDTALFTFSEIVFDKEHKHAIVSYSFYCGGLCGHGATVVLEKNGETWKVKSYCSNWIS